MITRRDLAVARDVVARGKLGAEAPSQPNKSEASTHDNTQPSQSIEAPSNEPKPDEPHATQPKPDAAAEPESQVATSPKKRPSPSNEDDISSEPAAKKQAIGDTAPGVSAPQPPEMKLELDTKPTEQANSTEEPAPDTATFSNTGDLDSLFNDPASAGGMGGSGDEPDFSTATDLNLNAEFDFPGFNAGLDANTSNDNDNISALLPGLQDYANDTGGAEPDFSSFFAADPTANANDLSQNTGNGSGEGNQQNNTSQQDTTFDDLFNLEFDMGGGGNDNQSGGNDFNFDFS